MFMPRATDSGVLSMSNFAGESAQSALQQGLQLCLNAKVLRECEIHEGVYFAGPTDAGAAYAFANKRINDGDLQLESGETSQDINSRIKAAIDFYGGISRCQQCP
jgi:hypothetical protein